MLGVQDCAGGGGSLAAPVLAEQRGKDKQESGSWATFKSGMEGQGCPEFFIYF